MIMLEIASVTNGESTIGSPVLETVYQTQLSW